MGQLAFSDTGNNAERIALSGKSKDLEARSQEPERIEKRAWG